MDARFTCCSRPVRFAPASPSRSERLIFPDSPPPALGPLRFFLFVDGLISQSQEAGCADGPRSVRKSRLGRRAKKCCQRAMVLHPRTQNRHHVSRTGERVLQGVTPRRFKHRAALNPRSQLESRVLIESDPARHVQASVTKDEKIQRLRCNPASGSLTPAAAFK